MFAQTNTDRSLNAAPPADVKTPAAGATDAAFKAAEKHAPPDAETTALFQDLRTGEDLSGLSREQLEMRVHTLTQSLAEANADAESFRKQWEDLKLRDEALGVDALTVDDQKLEEGKVQAVAEYYQTEMKRRVALQLLEKLLATTEELLRTAPHESPKVRADYEVASRAAKDYLAGRNVGSIPLGDSLTDGKIVDLNPGLNAVIVNLGRTQGVKEGMPFLVYQDDAEVATVKIVLARDLISAALIESMKPNAVLRVGDRVAADVHE